MSEKTKKEALVPESEQSGATKTPRKKAASAPKAPKEAAEKIPPGFFGIKPSSEEAHVLVDVPGNKSGLVRLGEVRQTVTGHMVLYPRAELTLAQWSMIRTTAQYVFNEELREDGKPTGKFLASGHTKLNVTNLGKELLTLAWAIESAPPEEVEVIKNAWMQLHRVERWWLYNQTVALNGDMRSRGKGWRAALYHALSAMSAGSNEERVQEAPEERPKEQAKTKSKVIQERILKGAAQAEALA